MTRLYEAAAVAFWTAAGWWLLPKVGINPWWSIWASWVTVGLFLGVFAIANQLSRIAGARWLDRAQDPERVEQEVVKLADALKMPKSGDPQVIASWVAEEEAKAEAEKSVPS